jgi:hypothetical protein
VSNAEPATRTPEFIASAREAWDMRIRGVRPKDIAAHMGLGYEAIAERLRYWREIGSKIDSEHEGQSVVEYHRELDLDRIEWYISLMSARLELNPEDDESMKLLLKLMDRKAKLIGEDSPVRVKVEAKTTTYKVEGVDLEALR